MSISPPARSVFHNNFFSPKRLCWGWFSSYQIWENGIIFMKLEGILTYSFFKRSLATKWQQLQQINIKQ